MIALFAARLLSVLAVLAPVVLALQPTPAAATVGLATGPLDGAHAPVLPVVRLGTTDTLYLRGADLLAQAERLECLEKLSGDIAPPLHPAASPSPD